MFKVCISEHMLSQETWIQLEFNLSLPLESDSFITKKQKLRTKCVKEMYNKDTTKEHEHDLVLLTTRKELALALLSGNPRGPGSKTTHAFSYTFELSIIL